VAKEKTSRRRRGRGDLNGQRVWCIIYMYIYIFRCVCMCDWWVGGCGCVVQQFASVETPRYLCNARKVNDMKRNVLLLNYYRAHRIKAFFRGAGTKGRICNNARPVRVLVHKMLGLCIISCPSVLLIFYNTRETV